jgi:hypothetical protein
LLDYMMSGPKPATAEKPKNPSGYKQYSDVERLNDWIAN